MRKQLRLGVVAAAMVVLVAACGGGSSSSAGASAPGVTSNSIKIGISNAQTGIVAASGTLVGAGSKAVFDQVNASGGVNGRKIDPTVLDDSYQAPRAVANTRTFLNKPVFAVFGGYGTIPAQAMTPILEQAKVPYVFPYQGNRYPTNKNLFLLMPIYEDQTQAVIKSALEKYGKGTVYALFGETADTAQGEKDAQSAVQSAGGTWVGDDVVSQGTGDYTPYVLRMKQKHPDFLLVSTTPTDSSRYASAVAAQGALPQKRVLGLQTLANETFLNAVPQSIDDVLYAPGPTTPASNQASKDCTSAVNKYAPGTKVTMDTLWGCATAELFVYALKKAGTNLTRDGLVKTLESMKKVSATPLLPPITFTANNHVGERSMDTFTTQNKQLITGGTMQVGSQGE
jgi:ABC-type branched-subunit amino acid transport system substrate-binding protein